MAPRTRGSSEFLFLSASFIDPFLHQCRSFSSRTLFPHSSPVQLPPISGSLSSPQPVVVFDAMRSTPVQQYAVLISLVGRDLMACTQTGSVKTDVLCFPIISWLMRSPMSMIRYLTLDEAACLLELACVAANWFEVVDCAEKCYSEVENIGSMDEANAKSCFDVLDLESPNLWTWLYDDLAAVVPSYAPIPC